GYPNTQEEALFIEPNSSGTITVIYSFDQPTGNFDLLLLDVDEDESLTITARDETGATIPDFHRWRSVTGDMSVWDGADAPNDARAPLWNPATGVLIGQDSDAGNDHRTFISLTPDKLVTEIVISFGPTTTDGKHIYTTLYGTPTSRDGGACNEAYFLHEFTDTLYTVNLETGDSSVIGTTTATGNMNGLAYDEINDVLWYNDNNTYELYRYDLATGTDTLIGDLDAAGWTDPLPWGLSDGGAWFDGDYYVGTDATDDLYQVAFNATYTAIADVVKVADLNGNTSNTAWGDFFISSNGVLYGADAITGAIFSYDIPAGGPRQEIASGVPVNGVQMGLDGHLYGIHSFTTDTPLYLVDLGTGTASTHANAYLDPSPGDMAGRVVPDPIGTAVSVSAGDVSATEGDATVNVPVSLSAFSDAEVTVNFSTTNGSATAGSDYTANSGSLVIPAGATSGQITITLLEDSVFEGPEYFFVDLESATGATLDDSQAEVTMNDNDAMPDLHHVGNLIFLDNNENGRFDAGDAGAGGVTVQLWSPGADGIALNADDTEIPVGPDGALGTSDDTSGGILTSGGGNYLFRGIDTGDYYVRLPASNFQASGPLENRVSSFGWSGNNGDDDENENGIDGFQPEVHGVVSMRFTIAAEDDNLTIDFGFTPECLEYRMLLGELLPTEMVMDFPFPLTGGNSSMPDCFVPNFGGEAMASDEITNKIYTATQGSGIQVYDVTSGTLETFHNPGGGGAFWQGLALSPDRQHIYAVASAEVVRIPTDQTLPAARDAIYNFFGDFAGSRMIWGVEVNPVTGDVYATSGFNATGSAQRGQIHVLPPDLSSQTPLAGTLATDDIFYSGLAFLPDGSFWVAAAGFGGTNDRMIHFTADGTFLSETEISLAPVGSAEGYAPYDVALGPDGNLYVALLNNAPGQYPPENPVGSGTPNVFCVLQFNPSTGVQTDYLRGPRNSGSKGIEFTCLSLTCLPELTIADAGASEAASTVSLTVNLSTTSTSDVSFDYTTSDGTALAGSDYVGTIGTATILAGSTSATISVNLLDDLIYEDNETFFVTISNPTGATIADAEAEITLNENDALPLWDEFCGYDLPLRGTESLGFWGTTEVNGASGNGLYAVGTLWSDLGQSAYLLDLTGSTPVLTELGDLPGSSWQGSGSGVSNDGSVVVGNGRTASGFRPFRWTAATGMVELAGLGNAGGAAAISNDGSTTVGNSSNGAAQPVYWINDGAAQLLPLLSGDTTGEANDVNEDGSVITGHSDDTPVFWLKSGATWSVEAIPFLTGQTVGQARGISGDGRWITGHNGNSGTYRGFLYDRSADSLTDISESYHRVLPLDVSNTGMVTGSVRETSSGNHGAAVRDAVNGWRKIEDLMTASGYSISGFGNWYESDTISDDGSILHFFGNNNDGWADSGVMSVNPLPCQPSGVIGNRVWLDDGGTSGTASDGYKQGSENGISGVEVRLHRDNGNGVFDNGDGLLETTTTGEHGTYYFQGLIDGDYFVHIPSSSFSSGNPLFGLTNSPGLGTADTDNRDNGADGDEALNGSTSRLIELAI
ncbi:MAG: Calx-beta domain-containing protein, partial [Verrucomicrobiota bacterium]